MPRTDEIPMDRETAEVGPLHPCEATLASRLLVRDLMDSPNCIATLGSDRAVRRALLESFFEGYGSTAAGEALAARDAAGRIVGLMPLRKPGRCAASSSEGVHGLSRFFAAHAEVASDVQQWHDVWRAHDPAEPHWHLGRVLVGTRSEPTTIVSALLHVLCAQLDAGGQNAYVETDRNGDVSFYELFGFEVIAEDKVHGVSNWFLFRRPSVVFLNESTETGSDKRRFRRHQHRRPQ